MYVVCTNCDVGCHRGCVLWNCELYVYDQSAMFDFLWQVGRGRPRKDASTKDALHQLSAPGGVTKLGKTQNVIVVPIQISKEMIAAKQGEKAAAASAAASAKAKESPNKGSPNKGSPKAAGTSKTGADKKGSETADSDKETKETPKSGAKAKKAPAPKPESVEAKSEQSSPEPTRRSKRESKLSVKLAEWGLLPSSGLYIYLALHFCIL